MVGGAIQGYRRENGRVGVRNHVIILPVDDISNAACEAVANNIKGTMALPHPYSNSIENRPHRASEFPKRYLSAIVSHSGADVFG
ncbi:UxaA family hydrolase [Sulfuritalea sp.]|uniref:UxaA family hydrolase n=1 Tax=Sulfuritalea sp. TaxID=2480090 RepID=UPI00286D95C9|nr:UxaA family hydrolase [Sulfuritalea sp.]